MERLTSARCGHSMPPFRCARRRRRQRRKQANVMYALMHSTVALPACVDDDHAFYLNLNSIFVYYGFGANARVRRNAIGRTMCIHISLPPSVFVAAVLCCQKIYIIVRRAHTKSLINSMCNQNFSLSLWRALARARSLKTSSSSLLLMSFFTFLRCLNGARRSYDTHVFGLYSSLFAAEYKTHSHTHTYIVNVVRIKRISFPVAFNMKMLMNRAHEKKIWRFFYCLLFSSSSPSIVTRFAFFLVSTLNIFVCGPVCEQTCWHFQNSTDRKNVWISISTEFVVNVALLFWDDFSISIKS